MSKSKFFMNVATLFAVLATVVFISCDAFFENEQNVTINLPLISSSGRAISSDKISDLKNVTTSYRVTVNGMTREGTGGTFAFTLPVGMVAEITVECLNSSGNVIVRAKKTHTVKSGTNNVDINLSRDGDVIGTGGGPSVPQPVPGKVTYNGGTGASNVPSDTQTYEIGNEVTLQTGEPTRAGYTFAGWTSNVELKYTQAGSADEQTISANTEFASTASTAQGITKITSFKMPEGGVVLTAKWMPITYTVKFNNGGGSGTQNDLQFTVEDNKALPTANEVRFTPPTEKAFTHWATQADGVSITLEYIILQIKNGNTSSFTMSGNNITLYAVWKQIPYRELSAAQVGDVICANGKVLSASEITTKLQSQTVAIVYKVGQNSTGQNIVWAVGKVISSIKGWATISAQGHKTNISDLQGEKGYTDGSTGLSILKTNVNDADGSDLATNYPAWDCASNYGTNSATKAGIPTNMQSDWYLPSKQELQEIYENKTAIEAALAQTGVSIRSFNGNANYWSSSQYSSNGAYAYALNFKSGSWDYVIKDFGGYICAVRQFTW